MSITNWSTGAFTYTPTANYSGSDSFTFKTNDGTSDSNTATVSLTVAAAGEATLVVSQPQHSGQHWDVLKFDSVTITIANADNVSPSNFELDNSGTRSNTISLGTLPASGSVSIAFTYSGDDDPNQPGSSGYVDYNEGPRFVFTILNVGGTDYTQTIDNKRNDSDYVGEHENQSRTVAFSYNTSNNPLLTLTSDPIVIDLGLPGIEIGSNLFGAAFDLDVDGIAETLAWTNGEDALLVLDHDGSGTIDDGTEVVSPYFLGLNYLTSVNALASLDTNSDGVIDADDDRFNELMLWIDSDSDGISQPNELIPLADESISAVNLDASGDGNQVDSQVITQQGSVIFSDVSLGTYVQANFAVLGNQTDVNSGAEVATPETLADPSDVGAILSGADNNILVGNIDVGVSANNGSQANNQTVGSNNTAVLQLTDVLVSSAQTSALAVFSGAENFESTVGGNMTTGEHFINANTLSSLADDSWGRLLDPESNINLTTII